MSVINISRNGTPLLLPLPAIQNSAIWGLREYICLWVQSYAFVAER